ncbi:AAA family ATPase [Pseudomonas sp. OTU5201]|uniref:AAA family ATPase n=1 Tax=Pseudomonas sp. OTU5201 TaxID=3043850 RepID=UPI00313E7613
MHEIPAGLSDNEAGTSIIIGKNGSGKSNLLNTLAKLHTSSGRNVIGIASSIYDKFNLRSKKFHLLGARHGKNSPKKTIKKAIENTSGTDPIQIKRISQILKYVGYSGEIGIRLSGVNTTALQDLHEAEYLSTHVKNDIESLIKKYLSMAKRSRLIDSDTLWLETEEVSFDRINKSTFPRLLAHEPQLKEIGFLKSVDIFLRKNGNVIPLSHASSGELSFITSMIYLSTAIDEETVILIDEPENSLHPSWQKEYLEKILDLFYLYEPKIIIATHSPLIVSGATSTEKSITIFKSENSIIDKIDHKSNNLESLLWSLFGVATPESNYVSSFFVRTLNDLSENKISINEVLKIVSHFEESSYDQKQKETLAGVREIANKIESRKEQ